MTAPKDIVRDGYDTIADAYAHERPKRTHGVDAVAQRERAWIARFVATLPAAARVLDIGCGNGEPLLASLTAQGFRTTAVDFSHEQIRRARASCPGATLIEADICAVDFDPDTFDGVLAYDSLWHLPLTDQAHVFGQIGRWLVGGGHALLTLGALRRADQPSELFTDLLGAPTYYCACTVEQTLAMLRSAGFSVVDHDLTEQHFTVLVRSGE